MLKKNERKVSPKVSKKVSKNGVKMVSEQKILLAPFLAFIVLEAKFFLKKFSDDKMLLKNTKVWYNYF